MTSTPVHDVIKAASIPANRPIDHLRRIGSGLFAGNCLGTVAGVIVYGGGINTLRLLAVGLLLLSLSFVFLSPWLLRTKESGGIPVVARSIATQESVRSRLNRLGLRVPVVAKNVNTGHTFLTYLVIDSPNPKEYTDPEPGTLYAVRQLHEGMGDLVRMDTPTSEQLALIERLRTHPKELSNTAPILPIRRSPLEPRPTWAAAMLVGAMGLGIFLALTLVSGISV